MMASVYCAVADNDDKRDPKAVPTYARPSPRRTAPRASSLPGRQLRLVRHGQRRVRRAGGGTGLAELTGLYRTALV